MLPEYHRSQYIIIQSAWQRWAKSGLYCHAYHACHANDTCEHRPISCVQRDAVALYCG